MTITLVSLRGKCIFKNCTCKYHYAFSNYDRCKLCKHGGIWHIFKKKINRNVKNTQFVSNRKPARNGSYVSIKKYNFCKSFEKLPA